MEIDVYFQWVTIVMMRLFNYCTLFEGEKIIRIFQVGCKQCARRKKGTKKHNHVLILQQTSVAISQ
jgi:hypothetical protein